MIKDYATGLEVRELNAQPTDILVIQIDGKDYHLALKTPDNPSNDCGIITLVINDGFDGTN